MFPSILSINHLVISPTKIHTRIDWREAGFSEVAKKLQEWANQITNRSLPLEWSIKETSEQSQIWQVCMHFLDFYFLVFFAFSFLHAEVSKWKWLRSVFDWPVIEVDFDMSNSQPFHDNKTLQRCWNIWYVTEAEFDMSNFLLFHDNKTLQRVGTFDLSHACMLCAAHKQNIQLNLEF